MNSEPYRRVTSSCGSEKSTGRTSTNMDFTLHGSPAPRCTHRSTPVRARRLSQPPNTPNGSLKVRKPLRLPIEKILLLNERMEFTKREKIKMELSSRQIKLLSERESRVSGSARSEHSSSPIDLSIDLSTVTSSDHESDTNSDDMEEFVPEPMLPKKETHSESSTGTESPPRFLKNPKGLLMTSGRSSVTEYPCSAASKSTELPVTDRSVANQSPKCFRSRSADLIHLYVSTINNKDKLTKYFRPCHVCSKACCICPDLVPESSRSFPLFSSTTNIKSSSAVYETTKCSADKMIEADPEITEFGISTVHLAVATPESESSSSEFSNLLVERYLNKKGEEYEIRRKDSDLVFDSGNSTLQFDETNESVGSVRPKKSIPLSVIQLATAAQCARILANSLESVLEIVDGDTEECKDFVQFKGDDINQLFETLLSLKRHYPEESQPKEWVDFSGKVESRTDLEDSQERVTSLDDAFRGPINTDGNTSG